MKHGVFERRQWSKSRNVAEEPVNGDRVAGDWLWELPSAEEVVARVERCPKPDACAVGDRDQADTRPWQKRTGALAAPSKPPAPAAESGRRMRIAARINTDVARPGCKHCQFDPMESQKRLFDRNRRARTSRGIAPFHQDFMLRSMACGRPRDAVAMA